LKITATAVSFLATLAGKQYRFTGAYLNNQWEGALVATGNADDKGTWRLTNIDLKNTVSNPNDPLPVATGRRGVGRIAFHWIDESRPEMETRAPDDRREQKVVQWARDMIFALDRLTALDRGDGLFSRRLDLARVGAFGHSFGGQAAGTVHLLDPRFRGGINLDGNEKGTGFESVVGSDG